MSRIQIAIEKVKSKDLISFAFDRERIEGYCKNCPNYHALWSCPPHSFDPLELLQGYDEIFVIGTILFYGEEERRLHQGKEAMLKYTEKTLYPLRKEVYLRLLELEKNKEVRIFDMGSCNLCDKCTRGEGLPCRWSNKMRYSLEALGFDVSEIVKRYLKIELQWATAVLPSYYVLVSAVAVKEGEELDELKTLEEQLLAFFEREGFVR